MPNQAFTSFTRTWIGFFSGNISEADLEAGLFEFGCAREHLFPHYKVLEELGNTYPCEVTWVAGVVTPTQSLSQYRRTTGRVPVSYVSDEVSDKFNEFMSIIHDRDADGFVKFRDDDERASLEDLRKDYYTEIELVQRIVERRYQTILDHLKGWQG